MTSEQREVPGTEAESAAANFAVMSGNSALPATEEPGRAPRARLVEAAEGRRSDLAALLAAGPAQLKDPEFVHDLRVAARRMGEVARLLAAGDFMDKSTAKAVDASLKALRKSMGDLRDADVTYEHLMRWRMPGPVKKVAREVAGELQQGRAKLEAAAAEQMGAASISGAMVVLARLLEQCGDAQHAAETEGELQSALASMIRKREKQMRRAFGRAARKQTAESLHEARIAVKKLRYVMELAEEGGTEKGAKKKVKFLKQVQELLGDHHDVHVIIEQVQEHLGARRQKPIRGLAAAWRKWHRTTERQQAERAADFFARSYAWVNAHV